jgi:hypothetical protein
MALCLCAWTVPLRLLSSVINTTSLSRQARNAGSCALQAVLLTRELVLRDGFSRLTARQAAEDLRRAQTNLLASVQQLRIGGGRVSMGLDYLESPIIDQYKQTMYQASALCPLHSSRARGTACYNFFVN